MLRKGQRVRDLIDSVFYQNGIIPNIVLETSNPDPAFQASNSGIGVSFMNSAYISGIRCKNKLLSDDLGIKLSESFVNCLYIDNNNLNYFHIGDTVCKTEYSAVYVAKDQLSPSALALLNTLEDFYKYR